MKRRRGTVGASVWTKFRLLMWKNFLQQWRHPLQTCTELLLPVVTMSLVLLLRSQIEPTQVDGISFRPFPAHTLNNSLTILSGMNITNMSIAYSPRSDALQDVLESAMADLILNNALDLLRYIIEEDIDLTDISIPGFPDIPLGNVTIPPDLNPDDLDTDTIYELIKAIIRLRVQPYDSSSDLRGSYALEENTRMVLAAVEFDDLLYGATELPDNISYALRFPERTRLNSFLRQGTGSWRTDILFPVFEVPGPRSTQPTGGNDPGYVGEMFIALQHVISTRLVSTMTGEPMQDFEVNLQRFPHPTYLSDLAVEALTFLFPMFIMMSFSYSAVNIVRAVTVEKEMQLKETLKIMGMPIWINWTAWFCKQFIFLLIAAILITVLLKVNWFTNEDGFSDYAVFTHTPWTILLFYIALYLACTIFFCFMLSGLFSKGSTAALFVGLFWYLTYIPAFLLAIDIELSMPVQFFTCLGINSAMSYGFQLMIARESTGGLQWGEFFSAPATDSGRLLFGHVVVMLVLNCFLYMLIALYLEQVLPGPFGTPKPWNFLFLRNFWCSSKSSVDVLGDVPETPDVVKEKDPIDHAIGVKMTNLTKVFGKSVAVNNLNLNIYDDQITVLLGHNGAGKSTTISMLTGNLEASRGSVWVAGHDMAWHSSEARAHIGLCPQHNVLYNELTVREHLEFFARLKGFHGIQLNEEINALIDKLELQDKRDYPAKGLSGGQKRRLCVGIALCGDARVVLLDEPTSGMDPSSRRALWDLLQKEKKGRSMILTTHFMDEADILGDRIAIMAGGRLQCVGSPYFLKRHFGVGYTLVIVKDNDFQLDACTGILNKYIPELAVKEDRGREVTYSLHYEQAHEFESMLKDLEDNVERVRFKNYGLIATSLEDVFMSVGSDTALLSSSEFDDSETVAETSSDIPSSNEFDCSSTEHLESEKPVSGLALVAQHAAAVWLKLALVWTRGWSLLLLQVLVPLLIIAATLAVMNQVMRLTSTVQRRPLTLEQGFAGTDTLLHFEGDNSSSLGAMALAAYEHAFANSDISTMTTTVVKEPIDDYYLKTTADPFVMGQKRHRWLTGATFGDGSATAWFSNFGYHDIAVSLAAVHESLLQARKPEAVLRVFNHPLEAQYQDQGPSQLAMLMAMQLASGIGTSLGIASAVSVMFYIKERTIRAKLLQKAAGIQPAVLWGSAAVFDWLWFLVIALTVLLCCFAFRVMGLSTAAELGRLYILLMIYGAGMLPLNYLASFLFQGPAMGYSVVFFLNVILGNVGVQVVQMLHQTVEETTVYVAIILDYILQCYPLYSLITSIRTMNEIGVMKQSCLEYCDLLSSVLGLDKCDMSVMCDRFPENCCIPENPYFNWENPGVLRYIVAMLATCVVLWAILMFLEYNVWRKMFRWEKKPPPLDESSLDSDVADEARHALAADASADHGLVARALTKYYGGNLAVDQVSFSVSDSECFGLLGVNGAGKTTTFKMLMGDETISSGEALVAGYSVTKNITKVHENIGYCPQFDALFGELTGRETLRLFSLLRALRPARADARAAALAHALGFTQHLDKRVSQYSGGNKRKLSTAVSLLGNTRLVFVDEPTTGVDPAAKRQVWRAVRGATRSGRGVVLTSHSMEECEALCSRLTIMVNGRFQCLGSPQHLKNKYSEGFTLIIKIKIEDETQPTSEDPTQRPVDAIRQYVETNFTNPKLMEEHEGLLTYYLPDRSIAWSRMFGIMERAKRDLQIEDYSISQTTLEQIFLQFTKYQNETENLK